MDENQLDYFRYIYFCYSENNGNLIRQRLNARGWTEVNKCIIKVKDEHEIYEGKLYFVWKNVKLPEKVI